MNLKEKLDYLKKHLGASASAISRGSGVDRCSLSKFMNGERGLTSEKMSKVNDYVDAIIEGLNLKKE